MVDKPNTDSKRDWAVWYAAELGWPLFPVWWIDDNGNCACGDRSCQSPGKHPNHLQVKNGCLGASANIEQIDTWWTRAPLSNIGMSTSHHPALDIDSEDARKFVEQHIAPQVLLPRVRTGRGGQHLHLAAHPDIKNGANLGGITGLDVRGVGGYVLLPPGRNASGEYSWIMPPDELLLNLPRDLEKWIFEHQNTSRRPTKLSGFFQTERLAEHPGASEGQRNALLCKLAGRELARGVEPEQVFQEALTWGDRCTPPYSHQEVQRTVAELAAKHGATSTTTTQDAKKQKKRFAVIDLKQHEPEPIEWLWPNWLPLGALIFVNGDPEAGKTWVCCDWTARITGKSFWPDATPCRRGKVLFCTAEDSTEVIKTRIASCGGDLERVLIPLCGEHGDETGLLLKLYLDEFEGVLRDNPEIRLVVLDTISAMLPDVDFHKLEQVQRGCQVLKVLAKRYNATIACLHHLPKDAGRRNIIHAASGSVGFTAAPRAAVLVAVEPGTERRILFPQKMSWAKKPMPRAYTIEEDRVCWEPEPVSVTWEQLNSVGSAQNATERAKQWLRDRLRGAVKVEQLRRESEDQSFSWSTVKRAADELGVMRDGKMEDRTWQLAQEEE